MASVRKLDTGDIPGWADLRFALWPDEGRRDDLAAELPGFLADERQAAFGLFDQAALVGFAEVREREYGDGCKTAPVAWLEGIYVSPTHEGRGHARALLAACEDWARDRGLVEMGSDALIENTRSVMRHGQWGFGETNRVVLFNKALK